MPSIGTPEIIIIALVIMVLFGSKKLPDAARSIGRSLRIFKAETKGLREDGSAAPSPSPSPAPATPLPIEASPAPQVQPLTQPAAAPTVPAPAAAPTPAAPATVSANGAQPVDAETR